MKQVRATDSRWVHFFVYYLLMGAVLNRMIPYYANSIYRWTVVWLLMAFVLLASTVHLIARRFSYGPHLIFAVELGILTALLSLPTRTAPQDYFLTLLLPLCGLAVWYLSARQAIFWTGVFATFGLISMLAVYGTSEGLSFGLVYVAGSILVSVLTAATIRSEKARRESQRLLIELRDAHQRLQAYAEQVETLAAAEERNRLARELHDSVSQTIFSMTLTAQAARILLTDGNPRVAGLLDHLQTLSQNALAEMRTLIQELRPRSVAGKGLVEVLRDHASVRRSQDGLSVDVVVKSDRSLPDAISTTLFRVVQEALNNVVKHAQVEQAAITVDLAADPVSILVVDGGVGFDPASVRTDSKHIGLSSMEERMRSLGGTLTIHSRLGEGTRVCVALPAAVLETSSSTNQAIHGCSQGDEE